MAETELPLPDKPSIAVMPFTNMSGDPEQEYFTDGITEDITEDIITELSRFHELFVIARNSIFSYKGKAMDVRTVARELGVRYVLEGSIRKAAKRIRVTGQLIDALTGNHIWAEKYDRVLDDVFELQEELTHSIVMAIAPQIEAAEREKAHRRRPENLSAYEIAVRAYAKALEAYSKSNAALRDEAMVDARAALAVDPRSTLALNTLAFGHWQHLMLSTTVDREAVWREGMAAATQAIEIDRAGSLGHTIKGMLLAFAPDHGRMDEALGALRRAMELNPHNMITLVSLGSVEIMAGNAQEALGHLQQALRVSPRDPLQFVAHTCGVSRELAQQCHGRSDPDTLRIDEVACARGADLPGLRLGEARFHVFQSGRNGVVAKLAFDQRDGLGVFGNNEVNLASIGVAEIAQLQWTTLGVDLELHPLQQMAGYQILEPRAGRRNHGPVVVVVLALFLYRAQFGRSERGDAEDTVDTFKDVGPARYRLVRHLQVFAQRIQGQGAADTVRQTQHQQFELAEVADRFKTGDLLADQPLAVTQGPAARETFAAGQERLRKTSQGQQCGQGVRMAAQFGHRKRMQPQVKVAPLQGVAAVAVQVQPCRARDQDAFFLAVLIEQAFEEVAPAAKFVDFIEKPEITRGKLMLEDRQPVRCNVVVELALGPRQQ